MAETTFPLTIDDSSPMWQWDKIASQPNAGWKPLCDSHEERCDEHSAHLTKTNSRVDLSFYGTGIDLYANITGHMGWQLTLDGSQIVSSNFKKLANTTSSHDLDPNILASFHGLNSTKHDLTLTTHARSKDAGFMLDRAELIVGTGYTGAVSMDDFIDDLDPSFAYNDWNEVKKTNTVKPPAILGDTYHASSTMGDSARLTFNGSAIMLYGPCWSLSGGYTVSIDSEKPQWFNGHISYGKTPIGTPIPKALSCLRFFRGGLNISESHTMVVANRQDKKFAVIDYAKVVGLSGGSPTVAVAPSSSLSPTPDPPGAPASVSRKLKAEAIAGAVLAVLIVVTLISLAAFLMYRRRRNRVEVRKWGKALRPFGPHPVDLLAGEETSTPNHAPRHPSAWLSRKGEPFAPMISRPHLTSPSPPYVSPERRISSVSPLPQSSSPSPRLPQHSRVAGHLNAHAGPPSIISQQSPAGTIPPPYRSPNSDRI